MHKCTSIWYFCIVFSGPPPRRYLHPYFSTHPNKGDVFVSVPADYVMEADNELLPTGRIIDVRGIMYAMFDLRKPAAIANLKLDRRNQFARARADGYGSPA
jgi:galactose mutarotase-like enzyme